MDLRTKRMQLALQKASKICSSDFKAYNVNIHPQERLVQIFGDRSVCSHLGPGPDDMASTSNSEKSKTKWRQMGKANEITKQTANYTNFESSKDLNTPVKSRIRKSNAYRPGAQSGEINSQRKVLEEKSTFMEENSNRSLHFRDDQFVTSTPIGKQNITKIGENSYKNKSIQRVQHKKKKKKRNISFSSVTISSGVGSFLQNTYTQRITNDLKSKKISSVKRRDSGNTSNHTVEMKDASSLIPEHIEVNMPTTALTSGRNISNQTSYIYKSGNHLNHDTKKKVIPQCMSECGKSQIQPSQHHYSDQLRIDDKNQTSHLLSTSTNQKAESKEKVQLILQANTTRSKNLGQALHADSPMDLQLQLQSQSQSPTMGILKFLPANPSKRQIRVLFNKIKKKCLPGPDPLDLFSSRRVSIKSRD